MSYAVVELLAMRKRQINDDGEYIVDEDGHPLEVDYAQTRVVELTSEQMEVAEQQEYPGEVLEHVWVYSQNDFNAIPDRRSSMVGDVAHIGKRTFIVCTAGWSEISQEQLEEYRKLTDYFDRRHWMRHVDDDF